MAEERFLSRWARRKNAAQAGEPEETPAEVDPAENEGAHPIAATPDEDDVPDEEAEANRLAAEAVDLETIGVDTDMSVFFRKGVPGALKAAAMRQLWRSDPVFACVDGLNDYDTDFTGAGEAVREVVTRWQVGKGFSAMDTQPPAEAGETEEAVSGIDEPMMAPEEPAEDDSSADADAEAAVALPDETGEDDVSQGVVFEELPRDEPRRLSLRSRFVLEDWPPEGGEGGES
ncbi:DUF3306 domain-containing protein [Breoghania sp.]|uniref:DUF3306 domain-containing protein n=1 Tax=Breoghania sp. TaxID=2065378 RepID=UPI002AA8FFD7|nr:DUF3306 domain-containing protein [Breoghania sp.]